MKTYLAKVTLIDKTTFTLELHGTDIETWRKHILHVLNKEGPFIVIGEQTIQKTQIRNIKLFEKEES